MIAVVYSFLSFDDCDEYVTSVTNCYERLIQMLIKLLQSHNKIGFFDLINVQN